MRRILTSIVAATLIAAPVNAAEWRDTVDSRPGAFVGARLHLPLGGKTVQPRAALTIAPTRSTISGDGMIRTSFGEGAALNFGRGGKPTLTLAGMRADTALGFRPQGNTNGNRKLGVSKTGWVAIGIGAALVTAAAVFYTVATNCADHEDECG